MTSDLIDSINSTLSFDNAIKIESQIEVQARDYSLWGNGKIGWGKINLSGILNEFL